jgi:hypothetical protein
MGAKFTIVLDTDDPQGLRDALEIAMINCDDSEQEPSHQL